MKVPFVSFERTNAIIKNDIMQSFEHFFDSAYYILGEGVKQFEEDYSKFNEVDHTVGVSNGLDALHIALKVLNIGKGDEVIVPSNTYIATLLAVSYVGATPVLVEPKIETYNIDPFKIEVAITSKTKAIMPVHLYGQVCEMDEIIAVAKRFNLFIIEDNAQAQGAIFKNKLTGSFGNINATSFYPGKNLGALGDAGAVTTNDSALAKKAAVLRNYGSARKYHNEVIGFNMRLDECQAGFLSVKLKHLNEWTIQRIKIAQRYSDGLANLEQIYLPVTAEHCSHVFHLYVIRTSRRYELQEFLQSNNIGTLIHYPIPPHLQPAYTELGYAKNSFPIAEKIAAECLSLPIWPGMLNSEVDYVIEKIRSFFDETE